MNEDVESGDTVLCAAPPPPIPPNPSVNATLPPRKPRDFDREEVAVRIKKSFKKMMQSEKIF